MKTRNRRPNHGARERGSILVFASIALFAVFGFATIAIDVGGILTAKNELQSAVDASALAAASGLTFNQAVAVQRGVALSSRNQVSKASCQSVGVTLIVAQFKWVSVNMATSVPDLMVIHGVLCIPV
jgi:uncharacterized membrane protein